MSLEQSLKFWIIVYVICLIVIALLARYKSNKSGSIFSNLQDFYTGARSPLGIPVLIFTFSATLFSAFFMVGLPGFLSVHGLVAWPYIIFGDVIGMLGLFFVGKRILELKNLKKVDKETDRKTLSPLELILPNNSSKIIFVGITTIFILPYLAIQISGFGELIESVSDGKYPKVGSSLIGLLLIYVYSVFAGIRGIAFSDFFQGIILFSCIIFVGVHITFVKFNGPLDIFNSVDQLLLGSPGPKGVFGIPALISGCILFASIPICQPQFLTRYLLIRNKKPVKYLKSIALGMGFLLAFGSLAIMPIGLGGPILLEDSNSGDSLLGTLLPQLFSSTFAGLFCVGVLAAAMSTADSILFSLGQIFSRDIYKNIISPNASEISELVAGKTFILFIALTSLIVGLANSELIVILSTLSFEGTLLLMPSILGGLFVKNAWKGSAALSMVTGLVLFYIFWNYQVNFWGFKPSIPATIIGGLVYYISTKINNRKPAGNNMYDSISTPSS